MKQLLTIILALVLLVTNSCDSDVASDQSVGNVQLPLLEDYLDVFLKEAEKRGVVIDKDKLDSLELIYREQPPNVLGVCRVTASNRLEVSIDPSRPVSVKWTTIHELGHCLLRMLHRDDVLSIMNSVEVSIKLDEADPDELFDEFFQDKFFDAY